MQSVGTLLKIGKVFQLLHFFSGKHFNSKEVRNLKNKLGKNLQNSPELRFDLRALPSGQEKKLPSYVWL